MWYRVELIEVKDGQTISADEKFLGINCFNDINGHWARENIIKLYKEGYIAGTPGGSFRPEKGLTRAEFIVMVARVLKISTPSNGFSTRFKDMQFTSHWAKDQIIAMEEKGYIAGFRNSKGELYANPDKVITRAEMMTILDNVTGLQSQDYEESSFTDIHGHWAENPIKSLESLGLIAGISPGKFGPNLTSTRAQAAVVIQRYLEYINTQ